MRESGNFQANIENKLTASRASGSRPSDTYDSTESPKKQGLSFLLPFFDGYAIRRRFCRVEQFILPLRHENRMEFDSPGDARDGAVLQKL